MTREVAAMRYARERGFPVPAVQSHDDRDMVLERVDGPTMVDDLARRPWRLLANADLLADLHARLYRIAAPPGLPSPFGRGETLLHLDLHPLNVILGRDGPMVIDWANAARGLPAHDVALVWIIAVTSDIDLRGWTGLLIRRVRGLFARRFLSHVPRSEVLDALPDAARYRLADRNLRASERGAIERMLTIA